MTSVNEACGNCRQIARSSAVTVSHPNLNMYRPGSVTRPALCHVTLLTTGRLPPNSPCARKALWPLLTHEQRCCPRRLDSRLAFVDRLGHRHLQHGYPLSLAKLCHQHVV